MEQQWEQLHQHGLKALDCLCNSPAEELARYDLAEMNLICAQGLPGAENLDISQSLATLDEWTAVVKRETEFQIPRLMARPQRMTEAQIRMWLVIRILRARFGLVHIDNPLPNMPQKIGPMLDLGDFATIEDFADSGPRFIHGLLGPTRTGTCSSLPVLYAAVARRLGYPAKVATNVGHVFTRWEDGKETFNIEGTGFDYINMHPDEYYVDALGRPWTDFERYNDYLLRGKTPVEELQLFLSIRGACLRANDRLDEALDCYTTCWRLMPFNEGDASNIRSVLSQQLAEYKSHHTDLPSSAYFDVREPLNEIISIAPRRTQAALFAARGIYKAFECELQGAREAFAIACQLAPDDHTYPKLMASAKQMQWHRLPLSNCILAGIKAYKESEDLIVRQRKGPQGITRLARAHRLAPRNRDYWLEIGQQVEIRRPGSRPPAIDAKTGGRVYPKEDVAWLLGVNASVFLRQGELLESRWAYEEAAYLMPMLREYKEGIKTVTKRLHEAAQAGK